MQPQGVSMKGQFVKVHLKSGSMYTGYLQDGADGIILEGSSRGEFVSSPPNNTVTIPADEIVKVVYEENDRWNRGQELNRTFDGLNLREVEPQTRDLRVTEERGLQLDKTYDMSPRRYEADKMFEESLQMDQLQDLQIARLDTNVDDSVPGDIPTHSYGHGPDSFHLNGLPDPHPGEVVGLVGQKGTGTTTVFKILAGDLMPNLGRLENPPEWEEIINHFHGEKIRSYLTRLQANSIIVATMEQDLTAYQISYADQPNFRYVFADRYRSDDERLKEVLHDLDLTEEILDCHASNISAADLQRIAIALTVLQNADVYLFDEPTTFLDANQKYQAVKVIRSVVRADSIVIVADPDLSLLDMVADRICRICGASDIYGDVSLPMSFTELIDRYFPEVKTPPAYAYPNMCKDIGVFKLRVKEGRIMPSEITIVFGEKKTGKSTFLNLLRDMMLTGLRPIASQKLQELPTHDGSETVEQCLRKAILMFAIEDPVFKRLVMEPFRLNQIFDKKLSDLSPSEKQMMYIAITLGKYNADVFLLDEPSAHLDSDQRMTAAQVIKSFIVRSKKSAIIVEDDMMMATHMGDKLIALEGEAGVSCSAQSPMPLKTGLSSYLSELNITCKHDSHSLVPRINKGGSDEDAEQRARGIYFEDLGGPVKNLESN